jgi:hypothetical protein
MIQERNMKKVRFQCYNLEFPIYECTKGYEKQFDKYDRSDNDLDCSFIQTLKDGSKDSLTLTAKCGFNEDNKSYCPMRRGDAEFSKENRDDAETWSSAPSTCHIRTTIQYCKDIESDIARSLRFRNFMINEWRTTSDNNVLVHNNKK